MTLARNIVYYKFNSTNAWSHIKQAALITIRDLEKHISNCTKIGDCNHTNKEVSCSCQFNLSFFNASGNKELKDPNRPLAQNSQVVVVRTPMNKKHLKNIEKKMVLKEAMDLENKNDSEKTRRLSLQKAEAHAKKTQSLQLKMKRLEDERWELARLAHEKEVEALKRSLAQSHLRGENKNGDAAGRELESKTAGYESDLVVAKSGGKGGKKKVASPKKTRVADRLPVVVYRSAKGDSSRTASVRYAKDVSSIVRAPCKAELVADKSERGVRVAEKVRLQIDPVAVDLHRAHKNLAVGIKADHRAEHKSDRKTGGKTARTEPIKTGQKTINETTKKTINETTKKTINETTKKTINETTKKVSSRREKNKSVAICAERREKKAGKGKVSTPARRQNGTRWKGDEAIDRTGTEPAKRWEGREAVLSQSSKKKSRLEEASSSNRTPRDRLEKASSFCRQTLKQASLAQPKKNGNEAVTSEAAALREKAKENRETRRNDLLDAEQNSLNASSSGKKRQVSRANKGVKKVREHIEKRTFGIPCEVQDPGNAQKIDRRPKALSEIVSFSRSQTHRENNGFHMKSSKEGIIGIMGLNNVIGRRGKDLSLKFDRFVPKSDNYIEIN